MTNRTNREIISEIADVDAMLSPENLSCDGEASMSDITRRHRELMHRRAMLVRELGRDPTWDELESA